MCQPSDRRRSQRSRNTPLVTEDPAALNSTSVPPSAAIPPPASKPGTDLRHGRCCVERADPGSLHDPRESPLGRGEVLGRRAEHEGQLGGMKGAPLLETGVALQPVWRLGEEEATRVDVGGHGIQEREGRAGEDEVSVEGIVGLLGRAEGITGVGLDDGCGVIPALVRGHSREGLDECIVGVDAEHPGEKDSFVLVESSGDGHPIELASGEGFPGGHGQEHAVDIGREVEIRDRVEDLLCVEIPKAGDAL